MANFSLDRFRTKVLSEGLAKTNRFEVLIPLCRALSPYYSTRDSELISLYCEGASLPPQIIGVRTQRIYGPLYQRPFGIEYGGEGLPMTFIVDRAMDVKAYFDSWMSKIIDPYQFFVYYPADYSVDLTINQLDEQDNIVYTVVIYDAFPRSITLMELNNTAQNQFHRLNVNFAYRRWAPGHPKTNRVKYPPLFYRNQAAEKSKVIRSSLFDNEINLSSASAQTQQKVPAPFPNKPSPVDAIAFPINRTDRQTGTVPGQGIFDNNVRTDLPNGPFD